jgi:hypothetical protein
LTTKYLQNNLVKRKRADYRSTYKKMASQEVFIKSCDISAGNQHEKEKIFKSFYIFLLETSKAVRSIPFKLCFSVTGKIKNKFRRNIYKSVLRPFTFLYACLFNRKGLQNFSQYFSYQFLQTYSFD